MGLNDFSTNQFPWLYPMDGRTDEQQYTILRPILDGRLKMAGWERFQRENYGQFSRNMPGKIKIHQNV